MLLVIDAINSYNYLGQTVVLQTEVALLAVVVAPCAIGEVGVHAQVVEVDPRRVEAARVAALAEDGTPHPEAG